jgi:hypothetical protein
MQYILSKVLKSGVKTSEFWVTIAALLLPYMLQIPQDQASTWAIAHGGAWAGYVVAAAYIVARAYIKGKQVAAIGPDVVAGAQAQELLAQYPDAPALPADLRNAIAAARAAQAQGLPPEAMQQVVSAIIAAAAKSTAATPGA